MRRASRWRRGAVAVEFGFVVPIIAAFAFGLADVVKLIRTQMRVDAAAQQLGQLVSQCNRIVSPGDTDQFWGFAQRIIGNAGTVTGTNAQGAVIVSAVGQVSGNSRVAWQRRTGSTAHTSRIGVEGAVATIPGGFVVPAGQALMVTEVYLSLDTWVTNIGFTGATDRRALSHIMSFMTRAPDAPSLLIAPANAAQPDCTR